MPATVIDSYSTELLGVQPPLHAPLKPNQYEGRIRLGYFTKTFASEAAGLDLALVKIPKTARILGGSYYFSATLGGVTTVSFGLMAVDGTGFLDVAASVSDNVAFLSAALASTVTTEQRFGNSIVLNFGYEAEKELYLTLTTAAGAMGTQTLRGYVQYVVD